MPPNLERALLRFSFFPSLPFSFQEPRRRTPAVAVIASAELLLLAAEFVDRGAAALSSPSCRSQGRWMLAGADKKKERKTAVNTGLELSEKTEFCAHN